MVLQSRDAPPCSCSHVRIAGPLLEERIQFRKEPSRWTCLEQTASRPLCPEFSRVQIHINFEF